MLVQLSDFIREASLCRALWLAQNLTLVQAWSMCVDCLVINRISLLPLLPRMRGYHRSSIGKIVKARGWAELKMNNVIQAWKDNHIRQLTASMFVLCLRSAHDPPVNSQV